MGFDDGDVILGAGLERLEGDFIERFWMVRMVLAALFVGGLMIWLFQSPDRWLAAVYPDAPSLLTHVHLAEYETLAECRVAAVEYLVGIGEEDGVYECGLNCEPFGTDGDMRLCEETSE